MQRVYTLAIIYLIKNDGKVKVSPIYDPYVGEVPAREDTCPGPTAL